MSTLTIHVMKLQDLVPDNYQVHAEITVKAGSDHQQAAVKQWFRQSGGEDMRISDASIVGSFISAYMPDSIDMTSYTMSLDTTQLYIDPNFVRTPEAEP